MSPNPVRVIIADMSETDAYTYIVRCCDGSLYTGWTVDLEQRLTAHNEGRGARYTRTRTPVSLVASWKLPSRSEAMSLEYAIKKLSKREKQQLILDLSLQFWKRVRV